MPTSFSRDCKIALSIHYLTKINKNKKHVILRRKIKKNTYNKERNYQCTWYGNFFSFQKVLVYASKTERGFATFFSK